jgi:O-antigen ligase
MRLLGLICWVVIGSILLVAPLGDVIPGISWYDQQRVLQIFVIAVAGLGLLSRYWVGVERWTRSGLWLILALGGLSSLMGGHWLWSLTELATFCGLFLLALFTASFVAQRGWAAPVILKLAIFISVALTAKFLVSIVSAISFELPLYPQALMSGFDNIRFFGQFQTMTIPLMVAIPVLFARGKGCGALMGVVLVASWFVCIIGGTRGSWVALVSVMFLFFLMGAVWRHWALVQVAALSVAIVLYLGMISFVSAELVSGGGGRLVLSSSGRVELWSVALSGFLEKPFLGVGPMGFAALDYLHSYHPHNVLLQLGYEWGGLALVVSLLVLGRLLWLVYKHEARRAEQPCMERVAVLASILAAGLHSLVSGVFVVPYTQLWLAVLVGVYWGLSNSTAMCSGGWGRQSRNYPAIVLFAAAVLWLVFVVYRDLPGKITAETTPGQGMRFWTDGQIESHIPSR